MIKAFFRLKSAIDVVILQYPQDFEMLEVTENDITLLTSLMKILSLFDALSTKIQAEKEPTIQFSLGFSHRIYETLTEQIDLVDQDLTLKRAYKIGLIKLEKYWPKPSSTTISKALKLLFYAQVLDLRWKLNYID